MEPLRPELYARLESHFGDVRVERPGRENDESISIDYFSTDRDGNYRNKVVVPHWGETYCVSCPFCSDRRNRLHINYKWGWKNPAHPDVSYMALAHCLNDDGACFKRDFRKRLKLYDMLFDQFGYGVPSVDVVRRPDQPAVRRWAEVRSPGVLLRLTGLPEDHMAIRYLRARRFDPAELESQYRISYCVESAPGFESVSNCLVAPIYFRGNPVGFQARRVTGVEGSWAVGSKYYTGCDKGEYLYNYDRAIIEPYGVVVEGITDAWRVGPEAVSPFGKTLSPKQLQLIAAAWRSSVVVILLDRDACEQAIDTQRELSRMVARAVLCELPDDRDPADYSREEIRLLIQDSMRRR